MLSIPSPTLATSSQDGLSQTHTGGVVGASGNLPPLPPQSIPAAITQMALQDVQNLASQRVQVDTTHHLLNGDSTSKTNDIGTGTLGLPRGENISSLAAIENSLVSLSIPNSSAETHLSLLKAQLNACASLVQLYFSRGDQTYTLAALEKLIDGIDSLQQGWITARSAILSHPKSKIEFLNQLNRFLTITRWSMEHGLKLKQLDSKKPHADSSVSRFTQAINKVVDPKERSRCILASLQGLVDTVSKNPSIKAKAERVNSFLGDLMVDVYGC